MLSLAGAAGLASWQGSRLAGTARTDEIWFHARTADVIDRLTTKGIQQDQTNRHPLVPLLVRMPLRLFLWAQPSSDPVIVLRAFFAAAAALFALELFVVFRLIGGTRFDATVFSLIALGSAASVFWFVVPEQFAIGALTILPAVALVAAARFRPSTEFGTTVVAAFTMSATVTNGMVGMLAAFFLHPWRRSAQISVNAMCIVLVLWGVQWQIFPYSNAHSGSEPYRQYFLQDGMSSPIAPLASFLFHSMVMPEVSVRRSMLSVQGAVPGSSGLLGAIGAAAWAALLLIGIAGRLDPERAPLRRFLVAAIAGQLAWHLVFGVETFRYAPHFVALLVPLAALGATSAWRPIARVLAIILVVCAVATNWSQFTRSLDLARLATSGDRP